MTEKILVLLFLTLTLRPVQSGAMSLMDTLVQKEITGYRQDKWCEDQGGQARRVLADQTLIDCITKTHAIKFEPAANWDKAIGEALFYGFKTGKKAGLVLIFEKKDDDVYWQRMNHVLEHFNLPIDVWKISE